MIILWCIKTLKKKQNTFSAEPIQYYHKISFFKSPIYTEPINKQNTELLSAVPNILFKQLIWTDLVFRVQS